MNVRRTLSRMANKLDGDRGSMGKDEDRYDRAYGKLKELLAVQTSLPAMERRFARTDRKLVDAQDSEFLMSRRPRVHDAVHDRSTSNLAREIHNRKIAKKLPRGGEHVFFEVPPVHHRGRQAAVVAEHRPVTRLPSSVLDPVAPP